MFFNTEVAADFDTCFVCGGNATTVEHVIPRWLQRRFNLWNEHLVLPNGSAIPYRQLRVPACRRCNVQVFGELEKRVENGRATAPDIWKWANKIHYGLAHKDRFLAWDRRNQSLKIGEIAVRHDPLERSRHFLHCVAGHFRTEPDPFGSVFVFNFQTPQPFRFAHFGESSSICVSLGDIGYVVFVEDGQVLTRSTPVQALLASSPSAVVAEDMLFFYAQCLELLARHTISFSVLMTPGLLAATSGASVQCIGPPDKERLRSTCVSLGLQWIDTEAQ
jgi:hypothetical protein